jgi:hypothetical protein
MRSGQWNPWLRLRYIIWYSDGGPLFRSLSHYLPWPAFQSGLHKLLQLTMGEPINRQRLEFGFRPPSLGSTWWAHNTQVHHPSTPVVDSACVPCPTTFGTIFVVQEKLIQRETTLLAYHQTTLKHETVHKSGVFYRQNEHNWERKSEMKTSLVRAGW